MPFQTQGSDASPLNTLVLTPMDENYHHNTMNHINSADGPETKSVSKTRQFTETATIHSSQSGSERELEALQVALRRLEDSIIAERSQAAILKEGAHRDAEIKAELSFQVKTLSEKVCQEKSLRRELKRELAAFSAHLHASIEQNDDLAVMLAAAHEEVEAAKSANAAQAIQLRATTEKNIALQEELHTSAVSCSAKASIIDRLQNQVAEARAYASSQTAALGKAVAAEQRLRNQIKEQENRAASYIAENELLKQKIAAEKVVANEKTTGAVTRRQEEDQLQKVLHKSSVQITDLQGQVAGLQRECRRVNEEAATAKAELQRALSAFELLFAKEEASEAREAALSIESDRQRAALAAVGKGFEEIAEQLSQSERRRTKDERVMRTELEIARIQCKVQR